MAYVTFTINPPDTAPTATPDPSLIGFSSHVPYWYMLGGVLFSPGQELWTRDVVDFQAGTGLTKNVQVQLTAGGAIRPQVYCIVPYPLTGGNLQTVNLVTAAVAGPNIVLTFQAGAPGGPPPAQFPLTAKRFIVKLNPKTGLVDIVPKRFPASPESDPITLPYQFQSRDVLIFERDRSTVGKQLLVQNNVAGVPPLAFGMADPDLEQRRLMHVLSPIPPPGAGDILLQFTDDGGLDPPGGPPPN